MLVRGARDGEHVVQRHRDVGDDDLGDGLAQCLLRGDRMAGDHAVAVEILAFDRFLVVAVWRAQLAPHLPAHPQQQDAAGKQEADDGEQLGRDKREQDAEDGGRQHADQDRLAALFLGQAGGREADDHRIVARQDKVDHDDRDRRPAALRP